MEALTILAILFVFFTIRAIYITKGSDAQMVKMAADGSFSSNKPLSCHCQTISTSSIRGFLISSIFFPPAVYGPHRSTAFRTAHVPRFDSSGRCSP